MEETQYNRKVELNEWVINARWFYAPAIFLVGILGNSLIGILRKEILLWPIFLLLLVLFLGNAFFYRVIFKLKKILSVRGLNILGLAQIVLELLVFSILVYIFPDKNIFSFFFFLPIISAAIIFSLPGAIITAILAGSLVNLSMVIDYFGHLAIIAGNSNYLDSGGIIYFYHSTVNLIQVVITSNFYLIIALFVSYTVKLFFQREQRLMAVAERLSQKTASREEEIKKIDKAAQLLAKKDAVLSVINREMDKKVEELELSEKSMLKAFSDLKEARKKSEEESNKIVAMIANFVDPILVIDKKNKLSLVNPAAKSVFGLADGDIGRIIESHSNYSMAEFKKIISREYQVKTSKEIKSENPLEEEVVIKYSNQDLTYKVITKKIIDKSGDYLGTMKIFYNLTREKMIDRLKSEFISIAAHQLRTPLSAIKWAIKMILDGDLGNLNKDQSELLSKGYQSNERIIDLVNDMLNVSRIEEGRFGYSFSQSDFKEVLDIVLETLQVQIKKRNIKLSVIQPKEIPPVYMDKQKMTLVLQNLLENAVKYTPEYGKIEVAVVCGKNLLTIKIKDNGIGIPKKDQSKLFSKFFRADNVARTQSEGSGLGLFIVKNVIERHNGDIICNSEEGKGTEFVITLPIN